VAPKAASNPFSNLVFMDHIVRAVAAGMIARASSTDPRLGRVVTVATQFLTHVFDKFLEKIKNSKKTTKTPKNAF
jgi:hypothetical protein